jgi:Glycosyl hydrolase family 20, catalytic domain/beta-acetyl hexosaminidase like
MYYSPTKVGTNRARRRTLPATQLLFFVCAAAAASGGASNSIHQSRWETSRIWPAAATELYEISATVLRTLDAANWTLRCDGEEYEDDDDETHPLTTTNTIGTILTHARKRFQTFLTKAAQHTASKYHPINPDGKILVPIPGIRIEIVNAAATLMQGVDESYTVRLGHPVHGNNWIELHAETVYGALYGLETIKQLLQFGWKTETDEVDFNKREGDGVAVFLLVDTPFYIRDSPAYPYRGFLIDTSRHYLSNDLILRNLNVLAANKLNVLHWHMTDSQSWPYQSERYPALSEAGAYCPDCVYNRSQIERIVTEAALRGIRVIVEVDLPGHSQCTFVSFFLFGDVESRILLDGSFCFAVWHRFSCSSFLFFVPEFC